ncbi:MAG: rhodanese-like domain-containing protein [Myxococcales bacterium]|nr:rhodanese-like domain-containing protein [Myxococcales bacterium]
MHESNNDRALRVTAQQAATNRSLYLVDIRPMAERVSAVGFIPGSRALSSEAISADPAQLDAIEQPATIVFVCATGRRSAALADALSGRVRATLGTLEGGTVGWGAAGFPLCGVSDPPEENIPSIPSPAKFARALLACFAAETAENSLDGRGGRVDPAAVIESAIKTACPNGVGPACMERALDVVSELARRSGFPLARIRDNVDAFRVAIARLSSTA